MSNYRMMTSSMDTYPPDNPESAAERAGMEMEIDTQGIFLFREDLRLDEVLDLLIAWSVAAYKTQLPKKGETE